MFNEKFGTKVKKTPLSIGVYLNELVLSGSNSSTLHRTGSNLSGGYTSFFMTDVGYETPVNFSKRRLRKSIRRMTFTYNIRRCLRTHV